MTIARESELPELLTSVEVAVWLKVNRSTLSRWRTAGTGPRVTWLSGAIPRYRREDLTCWIRDRSGQIADGRTVA